MSSSAKPRIAVIGLGSMGYGMASALKRAGFEVTGCDVAPETVQRFASEGGKGARTPAKSRETDSPKMCPRPRSAVGNCSER